MRRFPLRSAADYAALEELLATRMSGPVIKARFTYPRSLVLAFGGLHLSRHGFEVGNVEWTTAGRWVVKSIDGSFFSYNPDDLESSEEEALPHVLALEGDIPTLFSVRPDRLDLLIRFETGAALYTPADLGTYSVEALKNDEHRSSYEVSDVSDGTTILVGPNLDYRIVPE